MTAHFKTYVRFFVTTVFALAVISSQVMSVQAASSKSLGQGHAYAYGHTQQNQNVPTKDDP